MFNLLKKKPNKLTGSIKLNGSLAEELACDQLRSKKHKILAQNYQTNFYELDIISSRKHTLYISEVKYRGSKKFGSGVEYIGNQKLNKLTTAINHLITQPKFTKFQKIMLLFIEVDTKGTINIYEHEQTYH